MVAWLVGLLMPLYITPATAVWILPGSAALALLLPARHPVIRGLGFYGLGVIWCATVVAAGLGARLPPELSGESFTLTARVVALPQPGSGTIHLLVKPLAMKPSPAHLPRRARLSWYGDASVPHAGETWQFVARLRRPRGFMNPVRFDYERWLVSERIDATGYIRDGQRLDSTNGLAGWRGRLAAHLAARLDDGDGSAVLRALLVGDRRGFSDALWRTLRILGVTHLVAISGLHIGLVAGLVGALGAALWRRLPGAALSLPTPVVAAALGLVAATGYAALAGFSVSTQRALIMAAMVVSTIVLRRRVSPFRGLLVAAAIVLMLDPWAPLSPGFWLSFTAVAIILLGWQTGVGRVRNAIRVQVLISLLLLPLSVLWFGNYSWLSVPVNLLAVPLGGMVMVPGAFLAAMLDWLWPSSHALTVAASMLDTLLRGASLVASKAGLIRPGPAAGWAWLLLCLGSVLCLLPVGFPGRWLALPVIGVALTAPAPDTPRLTVTFLEVGQGAAAVVRTPKRVLVFDTGPAWGHDASAAHFTLVPFLREHGVHRIDRLILSHGDRDHAGGLEAVERAFTITDRMSGEPAVTGGRPCHAGQRWRWGEVHFKLLAPSHLSLSGNAASCVLMIRSGELRILLTGDTQADGERAVLHRLAGTVDVLQVAHHGSTSSTSPAFLRAARPRLAVISVGHNNRYGLPAPSVVQRLQCAGARVLSLAESGAVTVRQSTATAWMVSRTRPQRLRLYHERPSGVQATEQNRYDSSRSQTKRSKEGRLSCGN